jgi:hypothetical protein
MCKANYAEALNFTSEKRKETGWTADAGHCITVNPYPVNLP